MPYIPARPDAVVVIWGSGKTAATIKLWRVPVVAWFIDEFKRSDPNEYNGAYAHPITSYPIADSKIREDACGHWLEGPGGTYHNNVDYFETKEELLREIAKRYRLPLS